MKPFIEYLLGKGFSFRTCKRYDNNALDFENWVGEQREKVGEQPRNLENVDYELIMHYVRILKEKGNKILTIRQRLTAIKHYYAYREIKHCPAHFVKLQKETRKSPHGLLSSDELEKIYELYPSHGLIKKRDKVLLGLVVFQGATITELRAIEIGDVDLMKGAIYIPSTKSTNSRTLELRPFQLFLLQEYLLKVRLMILKQANKESEKLLVSTGQNSNQLQSITSKMLKTLRPLYPKVKSFKQIRQSRIVLWVQQHGIRKAQYMAGHRYVSSTERYNESRKESLKNALKIMHPLSE